MLDKVMWGVKRSIETYTNEGAMELLNKIYLHLANIVRGGLSSCYIGQVSGGMLRPMINIYFGLKYHRGTDIMAEDWDTLVLLDACRYDDFRHINKLDGVLESQISKGADSPEFIKKNFVGRELHDTVYVTANPHVHMVDEDVFHAVIDDPISNWDEKTKCVRPEEVTETAIHAHEENPNKRIIVHYMQPHDPPLGPTGDELREQIDLGGVETAGQSSEIRLFEAVANGDIEVTKARKAYRETLEIVLEDVEELLAEIDGRVVVSADHGEMFGEQPYPLLGKLYEHYRHPCTVELCKVPWLVVDQGSRRNTVSEPPVDTEDTSDEDLEEKLEALGYR